MKTIYSEQHRLRDARTELHGGELVRPFEKPSRAEVVLSAIRESGLGEISAPELFSLDPVLAVHDADYVAFLEMAWQEWRDAGYAGEVIANVWPARRMQSRVPRFIDGKVGYYAMAAETSISEGTWPAALASKDVALTAAKALLRGECGVFSLCRPPGHHAALDMYGGYCFLNNAAIATQYLRDQGAALPGAHLAGRHHRARDAGHRGAAGLRARQDRHLRDAALLPGPVPRGLPVGHPAGRGAGAASGTAPGCRG